MESINWEEEIWNIIDNYFNVIDKPLSVTQLDSYNIFLRETIPKTVRQFNPKICYYNRNEIWEKKLDREGLFKFKIEFYIGASYKGKLNEENYEVEDEIVDGLVIKKEIINDGKAIYINKPIIQQKIIDTETEKSYKIIQKQLYPNEARLKNLSYKADISCDILVKIVSYEVLGDEYIEEKNIIKKFRNIALGSVPIMLHSKACILDNMKGNILDSMGECRYDQGGYFIIDGKEKVIVAQERQVENKLYIKENKDKENKYNYEVEIRSVPEAIFQPARIVKVLMRNSRFNDVEKIEENSIRVLVPNFDEEIPLMIMFRALGIISDKEIISLIVEDIDSKIGEKMMDILRSSIIESSLINTESLAIEYLKLHIVNYGSKISEKSNKAEKFKNALLINTLRDYFLPHMGKDFLYKAHFLGYMVRELLLTKLKYKLETDRDSFINTRIDISGYLIGNIFRDLYFRLGNNLETEINQHYNKITNTVKVPADIYWSSASENDQSNFFNIVSPIYREESIQIEKLVNRKIIDDGFMFAFKNAWGLKNSSAKLKEGVVQDLNRLNYLGYVSHIRRVNKSLSASAKIRTPHSLHSSSYGIICPDETPDGGNIGLRKNLTLFAKVTFGINSESINKALILYNMIPIYSINCMTKNIQHCAIFLNERLLGYHKNPEILVKKLRLLRRNALINIYTSIAWYYSDNKIKISTDSGRCCRPLLIVEDKKIKLSKEIISKLKSKELTWKHLVGGTRNLSKREEAYYDYNDKYINLDESEEYLIENSGVIEYIDTEEANTLMIAMNSDEIRENSITKFTHCELHPSLMFGVLGNNLPMIDRNQHPRNQFSTAHGKQALGIYATNFRNRMDTKGQILYYPQKPIIQSNYSKYLHTNDLPQGINAIVAIGCYGGYNQEDSILFNKDSVERGLFRTAKFKTYSNREEIIDETKQREIFTIPDISCTRNIKNANYTKLDPFTGLIKEGSKVGDSDIIVGKVVTTNEYDNSGNKIFIDNSEYIKRNEEGYVDKVYYNYGNDDQRYCKIRIRKEKIPEVGDKFCSRFGQKGTIGMLIEGRDMPVTKDGIIPDLIVNPHAIPSRMTLGQLLEVVLGKTSCNFDSILKITAFSKEKLEYINTILEDKYNFENQGNEVLYNGRTGKQLKVNIFIGPTYYQRLTHQVSDKYYSRDEGSKAALSHQPVGGRAAGGGLRIGEMERDAILAHGSSMFLKETMMERSDKYKFYISDKSGLFAIVNKDKNIYEDFSNDAVEIKTNKDTGEIVKKISKISDSDFYCIEAPYSFKLFIQEMLAMNVAPRIIVENSMKKWNCRDITDEEFYKLQSKYSLDDTIDAIDSNNLTKSLYGFHNLVKDILLEGSSTVGNLNKLLDLSVGNGIDMNKWAKYNYSKILGIDINHLIIENDKYGARANYKKAKLSPNQELKNWANIAEVDYLVADTSKNLQNPVDCCNITGLSKEIIDSNKKNLIDIFKDVKKNHFTTIASFYTAHEYFENIESLEGYFRNIKENLKMGGYLLVTCLDGEIVFDLLKKNYNTKTDRYEYFGNKINEKDEIVENFYNITNAPTPGSRENFDKFDKLPDTIENGFSVHINIKLMDAKKTVYKRCLVNKKLFINVASKYGLKIISSNEADNEFEYIKTGTGLFEDIFKNFINYKNKDTKLTINSDIYDLNNEENLELKKFSFMHRYFVFKYVDQSLIQKDTNIGFSDNSDCKQFMNQKLPRINNRYIPYNLFIFSCGDKFQLQQYLVEQRALHGSGNYVDMNVLNNSKKNIYNKSDNVINKRIDQTMSISFYSGINQDSFKNTLHYMFENRRFGIFVKIKNGILTMFVPFFYNNYKNTLLKKDSNDDLQLINISVDPSKYPTGINDYYTNKQNIEKQKKIIKLEDRENWWTDNCIVYTQGILDDLYTTKFGEFKSLLESLCRNRGSNISDVEFFINKQKFPYLTMPKEDGEPREPYYHIYGNLDEKLTKNSFTKYMPILSTCTCDNGEQPLFADLLIPSSTDWNLASKKVYPPDCSNKYINSDIFTEKMINDKWDLKENKLFFKGTTAGCGTTIENNQRLRLGLLVNSWQASSESSIKKNILDINLLDIDKEDLVYMKEYLNFQEPNYLQENFINLSNREDKFKQGIDYKYLLYIDSYSSSEKFTELLTQGGVIFKTLSNNPNYNYKLWYFDMLVPLNLEKDNLDNATHININSDYSNLEEMLTWCNLNPESSKKIAINGSNFYEKYLTENGIYDYLENLFNKISKNITINSVIENINTKVVKENIKTLVIKFPNNKLKFLLGRNHINITRIKKSTGCSIEYSNKFIDSEDNIEYVNINLKGPESGFIIAKKEIYKKLNQISEDIEVEWEQVPKIIGKRHKNIKAIQNSFNVNIYHASTGTSLKGNKIFTIVGEQNDVELAKNAINLIKETRMSVEEIVDITIENLTNLEHKEIDEKSDTNISHNLKKHKLGIIIPCLSVNINDDSEQEKLSRIKEANDNSQRIFDQLITIKKEKNKLYEDIFDFTIILVEENYLTQIEDLSKESEFNKILKIGKDDDTTDTFTLKCNRGAYINAGVKIAIDQGCDYLVINNFDLFPNSHLISEFALFPNNPINYSAIIDEYNKLGDSNYRNRLIGCIKISVNHYVASGGYPNDIFGIGGEDHILIKRLEQIGIKIYPFNSYSKLHDFDVDGQSLYNTEYESDNLLFYEQINDDYIDNIYLNDHFKSGIKQPIWYNIENSIKIKDSNNYINNYYIKIYKELLYPYYYEKLEEEFNNYLLELDSSPDSGQTDYEDVIKYSVSMILFYVFNISVDDLSINGDTITIDESIIIENISDNKLIMKSYRINFIKRFSEISFTIKSLLRKLNDKNKLTDNTFDIENFKLITEYNEELYNFYISITDNKDFVGKLKNIEYYETTEFITYKNTSITDNFTEKIIEEEKNTEKIKREIQTVHSEEDLNIIDGIKIDTEDLFYDILGNYAIFYSVKNDTLYIKDIYDPKNIDPILTDYMLNYDIFLNTLKFNIDRQNLKLSISLTEKFTKTVLEAHEEEFRIDHSSFANLAEFKRFDLLDKELEEEEIDDGYKSPKHEETEESFFEGLQKSKSDIETDIDIDIEIESSLLEGLN